MVASAEIKNHLDFGSEFLADFHLQSHRVRYRSWCPVSNVHLKKSPVILSEAYFSGVESLP
jgi:hypothetical protein